MLGKIEQARDSKSGKTLGVKIGDRWYQTKSWELKNEVGSLIEFEPSSTEWQGQTMWWINDYGVREPQGQGITPPAPTATEVANAKVNGSKPQLAAPDPQFMPMTSNVVAHAIAAGLIKAPSELGAWASAAYHAAKACASAAAKPVAEGPQEFEDDIPF